MWWHRFKFLLVFALVACGGATSTSSSCLQSVSTTSNGQSSQFVPAGGYIGFADRGCTASFSLVSSDLNSIKVDAYTASHCSRDDKPENEKVTVSVHLPATKNTAAGYLKNLAARDEFFERRAAFVDDVRKLNNNRAAFIAESISKIPSFGTWWSLTRLDSTPATEQEKRNLCLLKLKSDESLSPNTYRHCWSVFDTGFRSLVLLKSDIGESAFTRLRVHLNQKSVEQKNFLDSNPQLRQQHDLWTRQTQARMGAFRLLNFVKLAAFLNFEMCGKYIPASSADKSACTVRQNLVELAAKHLVEVDYDGKKKNVLEKARELGLGIDMPVPVAEYYSPFEITEFQDDMEWRADTFFIEKFNQDITSLAQLLQVQNSQLSQFPASFFVTSNIRSANSNAVEFGSVPFSSISEQNKPVDAVGLSENAGIMKLYFKNLISPLKFAKTDSGSMITVAGIVPLLALNTVNDEPTSGGASILALPEAEPETGTTNGKYASSCSIR
ncbi:MAG: hypothetical protein ACO3A4_09380 [Silvanigrellaceae bacterium]